MSKVKCNTNKLEHFTKDKEYTVLQEFNGGILLVDDEGDNHKVQEHMIFFNKVFPPQILYMYRDPDYILEIKKALKKLSISIRASKWVIKLRNRENKYSLLALARETMEQEKKLANAYHLILKQHNDMKKMYAKTKRV